MTEVNSLQEKVNQLYWDTFCEYSGERKFSVPHVPRISENYLSNRVVVIGQETNTWYPVKGREGLRDVFMKNPESIAKVCLEERYDRFVRESAAKYRGKFWEFNRLLYKKGVIPGKMVDEGKLSHCWVNLFAVEACKDKEHKNGRPTYNQQLAREVIEIQQDLLYSLMDLLRPRVIIALTGPSLDHYLKKYVLKTETNAGKIESFFHEDALAEFKITDTSSIFSNTRIIRTYHPSYFMGHINRNKKLASALREKDIHRNNASYYKECVFKWLGEAVPKLN